MMTNIETANKFHPFTARFLPKNRNGQILDLGCGTGLEPYEYYLLNPSAKATVIYPSRGMLSALQRKFANKDMEN